MAKAPHILVVEAPYYLEIAEALWRGAAAELEHARATWERRAVPGAFEIPAAIRFALEAEAARGGARTFDGFVALGCVIRGETSHYELVCEACAQGLQSLAVAHALALGFGVLSCETLEQARARSAPGPANKGAEAVRACLAMLELKRDFRPVSR